jgi:hypothetical protein
VGQLAVCRHTQRELERCSSALKKVYAVEDSPAFTELVSLIDRAHREHWREEDRQGALMQLNARSEG